MSACIGSSVTSPTGIDYSKSCCLDFSNNQPCLVIRPISFNAMMRVHMQPEKVNFTVPQISLDIKFEEIEMAFQQNQYAGLVLLLDSVDRLIVQNKFWKYKSLIKHNELAKSR